MADYDEAGRLEQLRDRYASVSNELAELSMLVAQAVPGRAGNYEQWARLVEQKRDLTTQTLNRAVDHALGG